MSWEDRAYYRDGPTRDGPRLVFPMPSPLTFGLILSNLIIFLLQSLTSSAGRSPLVEWGVLTFAGGKAFIQPWRWITYQYLHAGGQHVFFNMLTIYFFVPVLERLWGWKRTFAFYTLGGILAGVTYGMMCLFTGARYSFLLGASGSILSITGALAAVVPDMQVLLIVIPMTMRTMALLFGVLYTLTVVGDHSLSDAAHLGGLVFGWLLPKYASGFWSRAIQSQQHRRVRQHVDAERNEQENVDRILEKVHQQGMNSLTWGERRILKKATEHQRQRDLEVSRSRKS